jgi:hypothetical protein
MSRNLSATGQSSRLARRALEGVGPEGSDRNQARYANVGPRRQRTARIRAAFPKIRPTLEAGAVERSGGVRALPQMRSTAIPVKSKSSFKNTASLKEQFSVCWIHGRWRFRAARTKSSELLRATRVSRKRSGMIVPVIPLTFEVKRHLWSRDRHLFRQRASTLFPHLQLR